GMHPMNGRTAVATRALPVNVPVKSAALVVVMPGLTGLPSRPRKPMSMSGRVRRASRPPMIPTGHLSSHDENGYAPPEGVAGTTTHGPGTEMQTWRPLHSSAARADAPGSASAATAAAQTRAPRALTGASGTRAPRG